MNDDRSVQSVAWRINAERVLLLAWSRAILLQLAHPLVAAGVDEHSSFRGGPFAAAFRLHHTVRAMLSLTFGDDAARERTVERIRAIHRRVNGRLPAATGRFAAGTPYSAEDPALLLWVHATLLDSILPLYDRVVAPLGAAERDEYCEASAPIALALGAREEDVPRTWDALRAYMAVMVASPDIVVGAQARALADAVLAPRLSRYVWPAASLNRLVTVGTLPARVRAEYGFAWQPRDEARLARAMTLLRRAHRVGPAMLWHWPEARRTSLWRPA